MRPFRSRSGIALITTLLAILVLSIIVASFIGAYRSHFSVSRASVDSQTAGAGCDTVYEYVLYRLEHEREWGSQVFSADEGTEPTGLDMDIKEQDGTHRFRGKIMASGVSFEAEIYNNLGEASDTISATKARKGTAICEVICRSGMAQRRVEFELAVAPLFDSSVLSRADLRVDANSLDIRSLDNSRNLVRAEGDIFVPNTLSDQKTVFRNGETEARDRSGMMWAKGDIHSYQENDTARRLTQEDILVANRNSGGRMVPQAESHFSIFEFDESQLNYDEGLETVNVKPGRWNFVRREASFDYTAQFSYVNQSGQPFKKLGGGHYNEKVSGKETVWLDVLEYYPPGSEPDDPPTRVFRSPQRTEDVVDQLNNLAYEGELTVDTGFGGEKDVGIKQGGPVSLKLVEGENGGSPVAIDNVELSMYEGLEIEERQVLKFKSNNGAELAFDLSEQSVTATPNAKVRVAGPFELTSETQPGAPVKTPPPTLDLGTNSGGEARAAIVADGDITISRGETVGLGALISRGGSVEIQPKNAKMVDVDTGEQDNGLLIYADRNVILRSSGSEDWNFRGLVYAKKAIRMKSREDKRQDIRFEGSLVSLQADSDDPEDRVGIQFVNAGDVDFVYNPRLLDAFVRKLPGGRIQLERTLWKG